jgi:hypothetical protein
VVAPFCPSATSPTLDLAAKNRLIHAKTNVLKVTALFTSWSMPKNHRRAQSARDYTANPSHKKGLVCTQRRRNFGIVGPPFNEGKKYRRFAIEADPPRVRFEVRNGNVEVDRIQ